MNAVTIDHETQQPEEPVEAKVTTALATVTKSVTEINAVEETISALETKYRGVIFPVQTTEGMKDARKALAEIRAPRYALQNIGKAAKSILNTLKSSVDERIDGFIERSEAIEEQVKKQIDAEEKRKKEEKEAEAEKERQRATEERQRVADIRERIDEIRERPFDAAGKSAAEIALYVEALEALAIDDTFAEFRQDAEGAKATALVRLNSAHGKAVALEAEQSRVAEERAALQKQQAEQARVAAIRVRIQAIKSYPEGASLIASTRVQAMLNEAQAMAIDDSFAELREEAQAALDDTIRALANIHCERKAVEEEQNRLAIERARIAEQELRAKAAQVANERRVAALQQRLRDLREWPFACGGETAEEILKRIARLEKVAVDESFEEFQQQAIDAKADSIAKLWTLHNAARDRALNEAALRAEREELQRQKDAQAAEEQRIADQRAQLEAQQEAARESQEEAAFKANPFPTSATPIVIPQGDLFAPVDEAPAPTVVQPDTCRDAFEQLLGPTAKLARAADGRYSAKVIEQDWTMFSAGWSARGIHEGLEG